MDDIQKRAFIHAAQSAVPFSFTTEINQLINRQLLVKMAAPFPSQPLPLTSASSAYFTQT